MAKKTRLPTELTPPDHTSVLTIISPVPNDQLRRTLRVLSALDAKLVGTFGVVPIAMRNLLESEGFAAPSAESTTPLAPSISPRRRARRAPRKKPVSR